MSCRKQHVPAQIMKRYTIIPERKFRGRAAGEVALLCDDKVVGWYAKKSVAVQVARELARLDIRSKK
jgi:hypothetical protein